MSRKKPLLWLGLFLIATGLALSPFIPTFCAICFAGGIVLLIVHFRRQKADAAYRELARKRIDSKREDIVNPVESSADDPLIIQEPVEQIADSSTEYMAGIADDIQHWLDIAEDCMNEVTVAKSPKVFFGKWEVLEKIYGDFKDVEQHLTFPGKPPSESIQRVLEMRTKAIEGLIDRCYDDTAEKISLLNLQEDKASCIRGFSNSFEAYTCEMGEENKGKVNYCTARLRASINKSETLDENALLELVGEDKLAIIKEIEQYDLIADKNRSSWEIGISFSKSSSENFQRAIFLAKDANRYVEDDYAGKKIYQAFFSPRVEDYLKFTRLYDLIGQWKSVAVTINGELIDRKIIGGINYCYGDKCRNGREDFCYGASYMTANPFGCHRLQMSACNHPWWSFVAFNGKEYIVDKHAIRERAEQYSTAYRICPSFNYEKIMFIIDTLPNKMTQAEYNSISPNQFGQMNIIVD